jgi:hypothetical protein
MDMTYAMTSLFCLLCFKFQRNYHQAQASDQFLATNKLATTKEICLKTQKIYKSKMYF